MTVTIDKRSTDQWQATLTGNGLSSTPVTANGSSSVDTIASNLATAISAISGVHAIAQGDQVTVVRTDGGVPFTVAVAPQVSGTVSESAAHSNAAIVLALATLNQDVSITLDGSLYKVLAAAATSLPAIATSLVSQIDGSTYTAVASSDFSR